MEDLTRNLASVWTPPVGLIEMNMGGISKAKTDGSTVMQPALLPVSLLKARCLKMRAIGTCPVDSGTQCCFAV